MTLIEEVSDYFGTKDLYEVLGITKEATPDDVKKAYRRTSLKIHPDRVEESEKEKATKKFQVLAQVHFVLSDEERRNLYDNHGIIANEDSLQSEADWTNYWRLLFPKITEKDINGFLDTYIGSEEEENDLIAIYNRFQGDLDKISETHISYDEERTTEDLNRLIKEKKVKKFTKFTDEPESKKSRRQKRAQREAKQAAKARKDMKNDGPSGFDELTAMIQKKSQQGFDSMIANLEAKYAQKGGGAGGVKRKRGNR